MFTNSIIYVRLRKIVTCQCDYNVSLVCAEVQVQGAIHKK